MRSNVSNRPLSRLCLPYSTCTAVLSVWLGPWVLLLLLDSAVRSHLSQRYGPNFWRISWQSCSDIRWVLPVLSVLFWWSHPACNCQASLMPSFIPHGEGAIYRASTPSFPEYHATSDTSVISRPLSRLYLVGHRAKACLD